MSGTGSALLWKILEYSVQKEFTSNSLGKGDNFGFKKLQQGVTYLGVPLFLTTNKFKDFEFVKERLEARIAK